MLEINTRDEILRLYSEEKWIMGKLGRESEFSFQKVRNLVIESEEVEKRSHKEACNTQNFKEALHEANQGSELSDEHKEAISDAINSSEKFEEAMKNQGKVKDISNEKLKKLYFENDENARKVSEFVDLTHRHVLNRLKEVGVDTSQDEAWNKGRAWSEEYKEKMSKIRKGKTWEEIYGEEREQRLRENNGEKISKAKMGHEVSKETRRKLRKARIEQLKEIKGEGQLSPCYNLDSIEIIEQLGDKLNCSFQHAENEGEFFIEELGYWVDGYDENKNIVLEYDEDFHFKNGKLQESDQKRMNEIINYLNCGFIRVKEESGKIYMTKNLENKIIKE